MNKKKTDQIPIKGAADTLPLQDHVSKLIAQWQHEKPNLESQEMLLIGRLINCMALIETKLSKLYAHYGINTGEFDVLCSLRRCGKPYELTPTQLFSALMITSGTMTNRLQQLKKKGLINRTPNPLDARSLKVQLSAQGEALIDELIYKHVALEKEINSLIPREQRLSLETNLGNLLQGLDQSSKG